MLCQAAVFVAHEILEPEDLDRLYFPLYELQQRALLPKHSILFQIVFTAVGVSTFWPDVLDGQSDAFTKMFRFHGRLQRTYKSSDGTLLYRVSEDKPEFV